MTGASAKRRLAGYSLEALALALAAVVVYPFAFIVSMTFKSPEEFAGSPFALPSGLHFGSYAEAWTLMHFPRVLFNTALITTLSIVLLIVIGSLAAYPLARRTEKGYAAVYVYFAAGIMLPFQLAMIPLYKLVDLLHLINSYHGAILIYVAMNLSFTVFLYTGFLKSTPRELEEAALIDGCSLFRSYWTAVFPLMKPATATVAVLTALGVWNDFIVPLLFLSDQRYRTLTIELYTFVGEHVTEWKLLFPGLVLSVTPLLLLYLALQKYMIKGVAAGAVKG